MWLTGLVALRHVGSSQTRARTCVSCIGRQILNHCATREAQLPSFKKKFIYYLFIIFYFWPCWVFISVRGLSLVAASGGHSSSRCAGLSLSRPNFPLRTAFAASYRFRVVVFSLSFLSRYFLISSLISSVTSWLFSSVFFSLHVFVFFTDFSCN